MAAPTIADVIAYCRQHRPSAQDGMQLLAELDKLKAALDDCTRKYLKLQVENARLRSDLRLALSANTTLARRLADVLAEVHP